MTAAEEIEAIFNPRSIAIVGASANENTPGYDYVRSLQVFGYEGAVYPINPKAEEILGLPAYPSLREVPGDVDYVISCIPAAAVLDLVDDCAAKKARALQLFTARFSETGRDEDADLERRLAERAREAGVRIIGPNCMGLIHPRQGITFRTDMPRAPGNIGLLSQSGNLLFELSYFGGPRGLRLSKAISYGNGLDLNEADFLDYFAEDGESAVVGAYVEGVHDGRRFLEALRGASARKPVVLLKGGRTELGQRAAASHTGALAGDDRVWQALARQTGAVIVDTLDAYLDCLMAFQMIALRPERPTVGAAIFGNGGGTSVLAVDAFARHGLRVAPFNGDTIAALKGLGLPPGCAITNPIDTPGGTLRVEDGLIAEKIVDAVYANEDIQAFVMHLNIPVLMRQLFTGADLLSNLLDGAGRVEARHPGKAHFLLVLRSDGRPEVDEKKREAREWALARGYPVFDELVNAGNALAAIAHHERFLHRQT